MSLSTVPSERVSPEYGPGLPRFGYVWLLGTDDINRFPMTFLRRSRAWFDKCTEGYDIVGNFVDQRNTKHIEWLKWIGVKFLRVHENFGHLGLPFIEFVKVINKETSPRV